MQMKSESDYGVYAPVTMISLCLVAAGRAHSMLLASFGLQKKKELECKRQSKKMIPSQCQQKFN